MSDIKKMKFLTHLPMCIREFIIVEKSRLRIWADLDI